MPEITCSCGSFEWNNVFTQEYGGHKGSRKRDDTEKEVFVCKSCGAEGRKFTDGVDGNVTYSGEFR